MPEKSILQSLHWPARLNVYQTAEVLGFVVHEIPVLVRDGYLKPLGKPAQNGHKYFSAVEVRELSQDRAWLDKATRAVAKHWQDRNSQSKSGKELAA